MTGLHGFQMTFHSSQKQGTLTILLRTLHQFSVVVTLCRNLLDFEKVLHPKFFSGRSFLEASKKNLGFPPWSYSLPKKILISSLHNGNLVGWILLISSAPFLEGLKTRFFLSHRAPSSVVAMGSWKDDGCCPGELLSLMLYQNSETSSSGKSAVQVEFNCFKNFWCWYSKNIWLKAERMQAYKHRKIRPEMFIWVRLEKNVYTWNTWVQFFLSQNFCGRQK